ncbi:MAG: multidrug effflux MFS transporter [Maricaulaceae bacterium]
MPNDNIDIAAQASPQKLAISPAEFVAIIALCISLNAVAIDTMLPALDDIAEHYALTESNHQQWVVFSYVLGFGIPQLFAGPLSDRFGRKKILRVSFFFYIICGFACMFMPSFSALLIMRSLQGVSAAGVRVAAVSVVRDVYAGRGMARIMSLVLTVFMIVPIIAPGIGELVLMVTNWRWTFGILGILGLVTWGWVELRLPETLDPASRRPLKPSVIADGYMQVIKSPITLGYMLSSGVLFGALFAFIGAAEQIFSDVFDQEKYFALWFGGVASALAVANLTNARIVERFGMRRISHTALLVFTSLSFLNLILCLIYGPSLAIFFPLFAITFGCFGMVSANFSALAMEPLGKLAGTGSAAYGFATTTIASAIGITIASQYNGTLTPILIGYGVLGLGSIAIILMTEKGRLFRDGTAERLAKTAEATLQTRSAPSVDDKK